MKLDKILAMKPSKSKWGRSMQAAKDLLTRVHTERSDFYAGWSEEYQDSDAGCDFYDNNAGLYDVIGALEALLDTVKPVQVRTKDANSAGTDAAWGSLIHAAKELLTLAYTERSDYYDDRTESWQDSDSGCDFYDTNDSLRVVIDDLEALEE